MPRFRVIHKISGEEWEVEATCLEDARKAVGWPMGVCRILMIRRGPFAEILPPKVAVQLSPPHPGSVHVCPDCNVTMIEKDSQDFWWQCPSCDQLYHEWENKFYKNLEG
jgi:hypothetical protein